MYCIYKSLDRKYLLVKFVNGKNIDAFATNYCDLLKYSNSSFIVNIVHTICLYFLEMYRYDFTVNPIADTVQSVRSDKHNRSDIINYSILLCISCKSKIRTIPQAKGFIIC